MFSSVPIPASVKNRLVLPEKKKGSGIPFANLRGHDFG
jgi:hypothetical protein